MSARQQTQDAKAPLFIASLMTQSPLDMVRSVRKGLPWPVLTEMARQMRIPLNMISESLDISTRTLSRRKKEGSFSPEESNKLMRLAKILKRSDEVFGDLAAASQWLTRNNRSLEGRTPLSLLDTDIGAELVMDTLGRLEHGIFA